MIRDLSSEELLDVHGGGSFWSTFGELVLSGLDPFVAAGFASNASLKAPNATFQRPFDNPANGGLLPAP